MSDNIEYKREIVPNLFLVGAMKAGTSNLHTLLQSHPLIMMSSVKEPNHFCLDIANKLTHIGEMPNKVKSIACGGPGEVHAAIVRDREIYLKLFPSKPDCLWYGESSTNYLRSHTAAKEIFSFNPKARIVVVLRDPIDRSFSHYKMEQLEARVAETFEREIDDEINLLNDNQSSVHGIIECSLYDELLKRFYDAFPKEQILVLDFSKFIGNETLVLNEVADFLKIDPASFSSDKLVFNKGVVPRFQSINQFIALIGLKKIIRNILPVSIIGFGKKVYYSESRKRERISPEINNRLKEYFSPHMVRLAELIPETKLSWIKSYRP